MPAKHWRKILLTCLVVTGMPGLSVAQTPQAIKQTTIVDARHYSNVFGEIRNYRVFLPPDYRNDGAKRYPVIYFFHGWSQRYFGSSNPYGDFDQGPDNGGDNIAAFVKDHDVIVVKADGYNRGPDEPYYVRPYNVTPVETYRQFPIYFPELVEHIDAHYNTIPDRSHRGISGLSMGGFMTFWIGGKYPHLLSAAGNFCGSPEFTVGPKDFPIEYRHIDMYKNYGGMNLRLHYGDKDFIRGYHEDMNRIWPEILDNYTYKVFDAAHSTCGMGEMLGFILDTFDKAPDKPARWHHTDVYPAFSVWDYTVMTDRNIPGFTTIENVDMRGFRTSVREFMPDGGFLPSVKVVVKTAPVYDKNETYIVNDIDLRTSKATRHTIRSDDSGVLTIQTDGGPHEIGINKETDKSSVVVAAHDPLWATAGQEENLEIRLLNKGLTPAKNVVINFEATRSTTRVTKKQSRIPAIGVNEFATATVRFEVSPDTVAAARLKVAITDDAGNESIEYIVIPLVRKGPPIRDFIIADGQTLTVANGGNGEETALLGKGNGDGVANPGESIVVLVKDQGKLWRTDLTFRDPHLNPFGINVRKSDYWGSFDHVGGSAKYDVPLISSACPQNHNVELGVEYWLPQYPLHIIRRGTVNFRVRGNDATSPVLGPVQLTGDNVLQAKVSDGARIVRVKATLIEEKDGKKKEVETILTDDGSNGDRAAADLIFSQTIPRQVFGVFTVTIEAEDEFGNRDTFVTDQRFVVH